jgi:hypothetical protein
MAGEAKRRVEWKAKAEAAVDFAWEYLGHLGTDLAALGRGDMLALLLEKALLRGGLNVIEAERMTTDLERVSAGNSSLSPVSVSASR